MCRRVKPDYCTLHGGCSDGEENNQVKTGFSGPNWKRLCYKNDSDNTKTIFRNCIFCLVLCFEPVKSSKSKICVQAEKVFKGPTNFIRAEISL